MPINIDVNKIKLDKGTRLIIKAYLIAILIVLLLWMVTSLLLLAHNVLTGKHGQIWVWEYNIP